MYKQAPAAAQSRTIGNSRAGIIEVPILGGLTIEEDETIAELTNTANDVVVMAAQAAQRIALVEEGVSDLEAYRIIEDSVFHRDLEATAHAVAIRHAQEIATVRQAYTAMGTLRRRATVTALLRHRLGQAEIPAGFPRVLFDALAAIAEEEQAAERMPAEPMTAEALGKQPRAKARGRRPTGTPASGS